MAPRSPARMAACFSAARPSSRNALARRGSGSRAATISYSQADSFSARQRARVVGVFVTRASWHDHGLTMTCAAERHVSVIAMPGLTIIGTGRYVPGEPVTNEALSRVMDTSDAVDQAAHRHRAAPLRARRRRRERSRGRGEPARDRGAGLEPADIDYIVFATMTPGHPFPGPGGAARRQARHRRRARARHPAAVLRDAVRVPGRRRPGRDRRGDDRARRRRRGARGLHAVGGLGRARGRWPRASSIRRSAIARPGTAASRSCSATARARSSCASTPLARSRPARHADAHRRPRRQADLHRGRRLHAPPALGAVDARARSCTSRAWRAASCSRTRSRAARGRARAVRDARRHARRGRLVHRAPGQRSHQRRRARGARRAGRARCRRTSRATATRRARRSRSSSTRCSASRPAQARPAPVLPRARRRPALGRGADAAMIAACWGSPSS